MKVFEKINELRKTNNTKKQMSKWAFVKNICPIIFGECLNLDCEYPKELQEIAEMHCKGNKCGNGCLSSFLNSELLAGEK